MNIVGRPLRVALAARVSTKDKDQNVEVQLAALRTFATNAGWMIVDEYADEASARDFVHRKNWKRLMADAHQHRFDAVITYKLDRCFRSATHALRTLEEWEHLGVSFVSITQGMDTTTPIGKLIFTVLAAVAEMERDLCSERVREGLAYAVSQGVKLGRPKRELTGIAAKRWPDVRDAVLAKTLSKRKGAKTLRISISTLDRLITEDMAKAA